MIFNTIPFIIFFCILFVLYWWGLNKNLKLQNLLVLAGSYVFYAWWDWRFLFLLIVSSLVTFVLGIAIHNARNIGTKKQLLGVGVLASVGALLYYKYTNFFIISFVDLLHAFRVKADLHTLNILLPLGISFYTFRMLSYLFEIKNGKFAAVKDVVVFCSYVSFFPSLISGPIDRPKLLIPQLEKPRVFDYSQAANAMRQILWGLFKKVVVADNCAAVTDLIFKTGDLHGIILVVGAFLYTIQIYADFSGYSDMAIGIARLLGFNIARNFNYPYFAQNIADFWRRWHISLTSWLTDYIFTPLSITFRNLGKAGLCISIVLTFLVSGLWHGANWTFVVWGLLHGCYFIPLIIGGKMNKKREIAPDKIFPSLKEFINILATFSLVMFTMIIFRADSLPEALSYYQRIIFFNRRSSIGFDKKWLISFAFIAIMFFMEWRNRSLKHPLENIELRMSKFKRWVLYNVLFILVLLYSGDAPQFIYLRF